MKNENRNYPLFSVRFIAIGIKKRPLYAEQTLSIFIILLINYLTATAW